MISLYGFAWKQAPPKNPMVDHQFHRSNCYSGVYPKAIKLGRWKMDPTYAPDTERSQTEENIQEKVFEIVPGRS